MTNAERLTLEQLNAYLISKGRPPKPIGGTDFVKQNANSVKKRGNRKSVLRELGNKAHCSEIATVKRVATPLSSKKGTPAKLRKLSTTQHAEENQRKSNQAGKTPARLKKPASTPKGSFSSKHPFASPCLQRSKENKLQVRTPSKAKSAKTPVKSCSEKVHKKLVRRSINIVHHQNTPTGSIKRPSRTPIKMAAFKTRKASMTPARAPFPKNELKTPKSAGPRLGRNKSLIHPQHASRTRGVNVEQAKIYEKLNNWLIAKGKKPLDGLKLRGFKPAKTISTPVGSPVLGKPDHTGSHWQGLKDEDEDDEIAVLIRHTMSDVLQCIRVGCSSKVLRPMMEELALNLPAVKFQAKYWVTLARIDKKAGKSDEEICDLFEKAIMAKAQPQEEIQDALKNLVREKVDGREPEESHDMEQFSPEKYDDLGPDSGHEEIQIQNIPTIQCKTPNPILRLMRAETPEMRNAATSPIVFDSPKAVMHGSSPSSVIKLKMVPRSSPIFNKLMSLKALPSDTSAIVTPVRRSQRIAAVQHSYPKSLQDHEPCLATVQEMMPALESTFCAGDNDSTMSCEVYFNPNLALGDEYKNLATVLKF